MSFFKQHNLFCFAHWKDPKIQSKMYVHYKKWTKILFLWKKYSSVLLWLLNSKTFKMLLYLTRKPIGCKILAALPKLANLHRCAQACPSFLYSRLSGQDILFLNSLSRNFPIFIALANSGFHKYMPNWCNNDCRGSMWIHHGRMQINTTCCDSNFAIGA